jgi:thioredoxin reductase
MAKTQEITEPRLAILGAGPIGLEAALYAATLGLPFKVYERGQVGDYLRQWGHVRLFSPFSMNTTPLGLARLKAELPQLRLPGETECQTGREHLAAYLEPLANSSLLKERIHTGTQVVAVGRQGGLLKEDNPGDARRGQQPFRLLLRDSKGVERSEEADLVLDCTGTYGQPRYVGQGGIPAVGELAARAQIAFGLEDILGARKAHYADRTTLVVGAGYSAATTISQLGELAAKNAGTWVIWLARRASSQPIRRFVNDSLRERDQVAARANMLATRTDSNVEFHPQSLVQGVESRGPDKGFVVRATCGPGRAGAAGKAMTFEVDRVIANVGYTPNTDLYRELQIHECYASLGPINLAAALLKHAGGDCLTTPPQGAAVLRNPEPGFFILGSKSYGRNSTFLLRAGFEQVREVFTLITGKSDLDLYKRR